MRKRMGVCGGDLTIRRTSIGRTHYKGIRCVGLEWLEGRKGER